jgi:hypothetical protein
MLFTQLCRTTETSASFYQTKWRNNPDDKHLHTSRRVKLKSTRASILRATIAFMTEAVSTSKTSVNFYKNCMAQHPRRKSSLRS